ncbi:tetratricopeptide repeat protein [Amycolatopsis japonica]|uniref:tetratricopeptide repeat protein n=1 Tax=Amycolatopsis japonica TaxID=208439 RepID=UPI003318AAD6
MTPANDGIRNNVTGEVILGTIIQGRDITVVLPPQIVPAMTGLPPATPSFTGRDSDLADLLGILAPVKNPTQAQPALVTAAVGGMGGVGKTELALQAARIALARGWFPGGVLFTDMRGYDTDPAVRRGPGQALDGMLRAVGLPGEHIPADVQDRSRLLRSVLAAYAAGGRRVLVVVDNVATGGQALPLMPSDGVCAAIVTSRHVLADLDARLLNLAVLPAGQATALLDKALRLRDPTDGRVGNQPDDAARLADLCAGLPLALQIVAAQLAANPAKPLAAMTADLDDVASRLVEGMAFADRAVHTVFDSSYHQLTDAQARLFRLLSLNSGPEISTAAAASLAGMTEAEARRGLDALACGHLAEPGATYGRWRLHDLLRLHSARHGVAQAESDQRDQALSRLLTYYLTTTRTANAHLDPRVTDPSELGFVDLEQAMDWLDTEYANLTAATAAAAATGHQAFARDLPQAMWHFLRRRRHLADWITLSETAIDATRTLADRDGEATALNGLGSALQDMRRFDEAIASHTEAAHLYRAIGNRHGEAKALLNLGGALLQNGSHDQAIATLQLAVEIFQQAEDRLHEVMALQNLGIVLRQVGRFDEAADMHADIVRIYRDSGDLHGEAVALNNLGNDLAPLSRVEEAITAFRQAARLHRQISNRIGEAMAFNNIGATLAKAQNPDEAVPAYREAARLYHEIGDRHGEGETLNNLGWILALARRFDEAVAVCASAAQLLHDVGDRSAESKALHNLGLALRRTGGFDRAATAFHDAAGIYRELGDRFNEAAMLHGLGLACHEIGRFAEAVIACQGAAEIFRELGDDYNASLADEDVRRARKGQGKGPIRRRPTTRGEQ